MENEERLKINIIHRFICINVYNYLPWASKFYRKKFYQKFSLKEANIIITNKAKVMLQKFSLNL
jgi:DeoR/GlpR family transcriptional regulator of sugar metabolism